MKHGRKALPAAVRRQGPAEIRRRIRSFALALVLSVFGFSCIPPVAAESRLSEEEVKAAVVANLPLFVRWPESIRELSILHICLVAPGALESALLRQPRASVNGQRIEFRPAGATPEQLRECEMVFVGVSDPATLFRAASALAGRPVLLVAEGSGVLQRGAAIGIAVQDGRVVLDVNLGALRREKFDVSAKLLRMARLVVD